MAVINGTSGDDVFVNSPSGDDYFGGAGNDVLSFGIGSGFDNFHGGEGTDTVQLTASIFFVVYFDEVMVGSNEVLRRMWLQTGERLEVRADLSSSPLWEQFQATDTNLLTHVVMGGSPDAPLDAPATTHIGSAANEILAGSYFNQRIFGEGGNDVIFAMAGEDEVYGGDGADYIAAGNESGYNDRFDGGGDADIVSYTATGPVTVDLNLGVAVGGAGELSSIGLDTLANIEGAVGSVHNDVLVGSGGDNTLYGWFGNDYLYGGSGHDALFGGEGIDVLLGQGGNDVLYGGTGPLPNVGDYLFGGAGTNVLNGEGGVDVLYAEGTSDTLNGGEGGDYFYSLPGAVTPVAFGGNGNDIYVDLAGGAGSQDTLHGEAGQDYCYGFAGNDTFFGGAGVGVFLGGDGDDVFDGGADVDYAWGGNGSETYTTRPTNGVLVINDFAAGGAQDFVRLEGAAFASFADVVAAMTFFGGIGTTVLTIDADTSIWFVGNDPAQFTAADFVFV